MSESDQTSSEPTDSDVEPDPSTDPNADRPGVDQPSTPGAPDAPVEDDDGYDNPSDPVVTEGTAAEQIEPEHVPESDGDSLLPEGAYVEYPDDDEKH